MTKTLTRKQKRAEEFGHSSPNREYYQPVDSCDFGIQADIERCHKEMLMDISDTKANYYFTDNKDYHFKQPYCQSRSVLFFLTH